MTLGMNWFGSHVRRVSGVATPWFETSFKQNQGLVWAEVVCGG